MTDAASATNDPVLAAIRDYVVAEAKMDQFKAEYNATRQTLLALVPKEIGEHKVTAGDFTLTIKYPDKYKWDAAQLDALYGGDKPAHVKLSYSVDVRQLKRLPQPTQDELKQCYEVVPGTPEIDVVKA